jgi:transglutaminase superfamily protein/coenzyme PQQ synthesis protein D (PqqD)
MTLPATATITPPSIPFARIAGKHRDGSVVLSTASDRIFKLNGVGALTWMVLEQSANALSVEELVDELHEQFENINRDGELRFEISREQLRSDTACFLDALVDAGLVRAPNNSHRYQIVEGVCGTTATTVAEVTAPKTSDSSLPAPAEAPLSETPASRVGKRQMLTAFFGLLAFDLLLRVGGFQALIRKVETWPTAEPHMIDLETCRCVCAAVNRAQVYYPKKAMCLQHSAVVTCLLRRKGVPAEMVLAAQEFPPKAHAWVEVADQVVNDKAAVREIYRTLRRI